MVLRAEVLRYRLHPHWVEVSLKPPTAITNRIQIWVLEASDARDLNESLQQFPGSEVLSEGIQTLSGMRGSMAAGHSVVVAGKSKFVGVELNSLAKLRQDHIDLTSRLEFTEAGPNSITTNLLAATARLGTIGPLLRRFPVS